MTNPTPIKIFKEIVPNGYSVVEYEYYWHKGERIKHGWYKSCQTRLIIEGGNYKNNKKDGKWLLYMDEMVDGEWQWRGRLKAEEHYVDGKKEGKSVSYWRNGRVNWVSNYVDDKLEGETIGYMENGKIGTIGNWVNGKKEGRWVQYDEDGDIKDDDIFKNSLRVGWLAAKLKENKDGDGGDR